MKKIIHKLRNRPEEEKRHILHITTIIVGILLVFLWTLTLGRTIKNKDVQMKIKQDLQPFSVLKDSVAGGINSINGQSSEN